MRFIILVLLFIGFASCDNEENLRFDTKASSWESLQLSKKRGDIFYRASQIPLDYYLNKYNSSKDSINMDSLRLAFSSDRVFVIEFEQDQSKDLLEESFTKKSYQQGVEYLAFTIQKDFKVLTTNQDTIDAIGVNFERNFKIAPFKRLMVHFTGIPENDVIKLIYSDSLFGNGEIVYDFNKLPIKL